jgi:radical SAM protein with 4Fe4S-binding SPASM domain
MPNINNVIYTNDNVETILSKKISNTDDFLLNIDGFLESQKYNLFYNRRIFIDNENNIKHSIEENEKYGMIKNQNLIEIISNNEFKKLWGISKNQIEVCRDCEYRYICPDNRIPVEKGKDLYYHLTDCNYNPYTNLWQ